MRKLILALITIALATPAWARIERPISKSFPAHAGGHLIVDAEFGDIEVREGNADRVDVTVHRTARTNDEKDAEKIFKKIDVRFDQSGDTVKVDIDHASSSKVFGMSFLFSTNLELKTIVTVPKQFNVELSTAGGDVSVAGIIGDLRSGTSGGDVVFDRVQGKIKGRTSGGDIRVVHTKAEADVSTSGGDVLLAGVFGPVNARTSGGDISIAGEAGAVDARTSGGDVDITAAIVGSLVAKTSGGSIEANLTQAPRDSVELGTSGGSVTLAVPENSGFVLDAETSGGRVTVEFPITINAGIAQESVAGKINGGGPNIRLRTSAGSIRVKKTAAAR
jgi:hypothetical protein